MNYTSSFISKLFFSRFIYLCIHYCSSIYYYIFISIFKRFIFILVLFHFIFICVFFILSHWVFPLLFSFPYHSITLLIILFYLFFIWINFFFYLWRKTWLASVTLFEFLRLNFSHPIFLRYLINLIWFSTLYYQYSFSFQVLLSFIKSLSFSI